MPRYKLIDSVTGEVVAESETINRPQATERKAKAPKASVFNFTEKELIAIVIGGVLLLAIA